MIRFVLEIDLHGGGCHDGAHLIEADFSLELGFDEATGNIICSSFKVMDGDRDITEHFNTTTVVDFYEKWVSEQA